MKRKSKSKSIDYAKKCACFKIEHKKDDEKRSTFFHVKANCPQCGVEIELKNDKHGRPKELSSCYMCKKEFNDIKNKPLDVIAKDFNNINWDEQPKWSSKNTNSLIALVEKKIQKISFKNLSFDQLVDTIKEVLLTANNLQKVRAITYDKYGSPYKTYCGHLNDLVREILQTKIRDEDSFSVCELLVLKQLDNRIHAYFDLPEYNAATDDLTEIKAQHKEVNSFNFKQYGVDKKEAVKEYNEAHEKLLQEIEAWRALRDHAGNEIIVWSKQKITLQLKKLGYSFKSWKTRRYIEDWKKHLKKSGVKVTVKLSNIKKKEKAFAKGKEVNQEDLLKIFKSGSADHTADAIKNMNLDTLTDLMESDLKCIHNRAEKNIDSIMARIKELTESKKKSIQYLRKLSRQDKAPRFYDAIISFLHKHKALEKLTDEFFLTNVEYVKSEDYVRFIEAKSEKSEDSRFARYKQMTISEELWNRIISVLPEEHWVTLHPSISAEFIKRMSVEDKIKSFRNKNITFWRQDLETLTQDIPWGQLHPVILELHERKGDILKYLTNRMVQESDLELLKETLIKGEIKNFSSFTPFSYEEKVDIIVKANEDKYSHGKYSSSLDYIFSPTELESLLKDFLGRNYDDHVESIVSLLPIEKVSEIILSVEYPQWPMWSKPCFIKVKENKEVVKHILKHNQLNTRYMDRYNQSRMGDRQVTLGYLQVLNREDIIEVYGEEFIERYIGTWVPHVMTPEEILKKAETDYEFARQHIEKMPKEFLNKLKDENFYKEVVGNRTYKENRNFANTLESLLAA